MFGSQALEVAIGLTLVFLLISLVLTAVLEAIEAFQKTRAADLERAIAELLQDRDGSGLRKQLYQHPLVFGLFPGNATLTCFDSFGKRVKRAAGAPTVEAAPAQGSGSHASPKNLPSYIPRELFSATIDDLLSSGEHEGPFKEAYDALRRTVGGDVAATRQRLEQWYDAAMDRASGWYKRRSQKIVGWLGFALAVLLNINAVLIGQHLATNEVARAQAVKLAGTVTPESLAGTAEERAAKFNQQVQALGLPVGWDEAQVADIAGRMRGHPLNIALEVLLLLSGYAIVGIAATLGAPFWFDVLGKIMVVRSTVKPTEKSPDEQSKDQGTGGSPTRAAQPNGATGAAADEPVGDVPADRMDANSDQPVEFG
jgi:hypothetical protein